ncbi:MAG: hypothetical protein AAGA30_14550 [Planctomycetota bacterium]
MKRLITGIFVSVLATTAAFGGEGDYEIVVVYQPEKPVNTGSTTIGGVLIQGSRSKNGSTKSKVGLIDSVVSNEDKAKMQECKELMEQMANNLLSQWFSSDNSELNENHKKVKGNQVAFKEAGCDEFFASTLGQEIVEEIAEKAPS